MSKVEKFSGIIASRISKNLSLDNDKEEVLAYGAFFLIQTTISILLVIVFGIVFNVLIESIIISFSSAILRKYSGGAHASSPMNCSIIGMIIFGVLALCVKHYIINLSFTFLVAGMIVSFVFTYYIMYKYSPVGTASKPLKKENTRNRLRIKSINLVYFLFLASAFFVFIYVQIKQLNLINIAICISVGALWQSITLVSLGHEIIDVIDNILGGTTKLIRGKN